MHGSGFRLGVASVDVTPERPLPLIGFGLRPKPFQGVARRLRLRALVLEHAGARAAIVSADLLYWGREQVAWLRERLREGAGIPPELLLLHATHTHGGPQTTNVMAPVQPLADPGYVELLRSRTLEAVGAATDGLEDVTVAVGRSRCGFGINRRLWRDGRVAMAPNPDGINDQAVTAVAFRRADGRPKAVLVHFTCHPTTSAENVISPDFPGAAMDMLEADLGPGAVAAYLQGCCGEVRPALVADGRFRRGTQDDVTRLGAELAAAARAAVADAVTPLPEGEITGRGRVVDVPCARVPSDAEVREIATRPETEGRWGRRLLANADWRGGHARLEVASLRIGPALALVSLGAEPAVAYGLEARAMGGGATVLPVGYANGMLGYLPTAAQLAEGGYEADRSTWFYGLPSPLAPAAEPLTVEAMREVLAGG